MSQVAAMFDLDRTLLDTSSGNLYARYQYRIGLMNHRQLLQVGWWSFLTRLGVLKMDSLIPKLVATAQGQSEADMLCQCDGWFEQDVLPHVTEQGLACVRGHQSQGHVVAIVSASTQYVVGPMAAYLGIPGNYVCTHLESEAGWLTGRITPPPCYGPGKVTWAERFAAAHDVDLDQSFFYTDSISDLPLLERVGHPVAVNPDPRLRRRARRQGWPIELFY